MRGARNSDPTTLWLVLVLTAIVLATVVTAWDARQRYRAETTAIRLRAGADTKLEDLREKIDAQQDLLTAGLALLGLMVAVGGLLLPVWTHVASIAPGQRLADDAQRAIKDAREAVDGLDAKFANLTAEYRQRELDQAIVSLDAAGLEQAMALQHITTARSAQSRFSILRTRPAGPRWVFGPNSRGFLLTTHPRTLRA